MSIFSSEFGDELITPEGLGLVPTEKLLEGKALIGLFFAAHWAPPSRQFTPVLKEFYEAVFDSGKLEIIFISADRSEAEMMSYYKESHGSWAVMPFLCSQRQILKEKYGVRGLPSLLILSAADLKIITKEGRNKISELEPNVALDEFLSFI